MRTLRALLFAVSLCVVFPAPQAGAQDKPSPEALQAATELVSIISDGMIWDLSTRITADSWPAVEAAIRVRNPNVSPEVLKDLRNEFDRLEYAYMGELVNAMPTLYALYFTPAELREITAFYRTPTGKKVMQTMPIVTAEFVRMVVPYLPNVAENVRQAFNEVLRRRGVAQ